MSTHWRDYTPEQKAAAQAKNAAKRRANRAKGKCTCGREIHVGTATNGEPYKQCRQCIWGSEVDDLVAEEWCVECQIDLQYGHRKGCRLRGEKR